MDEKNGKVANIEVGDGRVEEGGEGPGKCHDEISAAWA